MSRLDADDSSFIGSFFILTFVGSSIITSIFGSAVIESQQQILHNQQQIIQLLESR